MWEWLDWDKGEEYLREGVVSLVSVVVSVGLVMTGLVLIAVIGSVAWVAGSFLVGLIVGGW